MLALARSSGCNKDLRKTLFFVTTSFNIVCSLILIIKHNQFLEGVPYGPLRVKSIKKSFLDLTNMLRIGSFGGFA